MVAFTGAIAAVLMVNLGRAVAGSAILLTLVVGALIGAWQGYWVAYFGIPAFIVTLAGMLIFRALTLTCWATRASPRSPTRSARSPTASCPATSATSASARSGGADLFTLLVGAGRRWPGIVGHPVAGPPGPRRRTARTVDPLPLFIAQMVARRGAIVMFLVVQLARFKNLPWVLVLLAVLVLVYTLLTNRSSSAATSTPSAATCTPPSCPASRSSR